MAKITCCDNCKSTNIKEVGEEKTNQHTTEKSGWWGLGGSFATDYVRHYTLYKKYECNECSCEFRELEYSC